MVCEPVRFRRCRDFRCDPCNAKAAWRRTDDVPNSNFSSILQISRWVVLIFFFSCILVSGHSLMKPRVPSTLFLSSACSASFDCASIQRGRRSCDFLISCRPFLRNSRLLLIAHSSQCNFFWLVQSDFPSFRARRTLWILPYTVSRSESLNSVKIFSHSWNSFWWKFRCVEIDDLQI